MRIILPVFGFRFLEETTTQNQAESTPGATETPKTLESGSTLTLPTKDLFKITGNIAEAFMYVHDSRFVVVKGSQANKKESPTIGKNWVNLRKKLLHQKILIDKGSHYVFTEDTFFDSTSAASSVVLGRQTSGPISWIHLDSNLKYSQMLEAGLL